ncbi:MAG: dipeptidase [Bacteroidia bacterium]|nr:dipeptidase [Bacteroidia bacterium]
MENIKQYIEAHRARFLDELFELLRIPSISSLTEHKGDILNTAEKIKEMLLKAGADKAEVLSTEGNPVIYAEKYIKPSAPTVLVYGHYDVMPVDPLENWQTPPFEPSIKDGKIFARGADDDKGQLFMHIKAMEIMVSTSTLPCNLKFIIEGEEEVGSASITAFCKQNKDLLKADIILVSDTSMLGKNTPSITTGLRGLSYFQIELTGPDRDLHSGIFGGAVANPINILCRLIASLTDSNNSITIPGFYQDVIELGKEERDELNKAPFSENDYKQSVGVDELYGEKGYSSLERTGIRPTLDVCGIWGGYTGEGAKTIIPSKAYAKISMRLVPNQDYHKITQIAEDYLKSIAPAYVKVKVIPLHGGQCYVSPTTLPAYQAASKAYEKTFGKKPIPVRRGGSIPIIATFEEILGIKTILMGFGLESDAIHSPNENYPLENLFIGIETICYFYKYYSEI